MSVTTLASAPSAAPTTRSRRTAGPSTPPRGFVLTVDLSAVDDQDPAEVLRSIATLAELANEWFPRARTRAALTSDDRPVRPVRQRPGLRERLEAIGDHTEVEVDPDARTVRTAGREVGLTERETALLVYLAGAGDRTVTRDELLDSVWHTQPGADDRIETRTVDVHVRRVRQKTGLAELIATVWGSGYRLDPRYRVRLAA